MTQDIIGYYVVRCETATGTREHSAHPFTADITTRIAAETIAYNTADRLTNDPANRAVTVRACTSSMLTEAR